MSKVLEGLEAVWMVSIDDFIIRDSSQGELVANLAEVVGRLPDIGLFLARHKCRCLEPPTVNWCGMSYSGWRVEHNPEPVCGLSDMRRSESVGALTKFL